MTATQPTILLVEEEQSVRSSVENLLRDEGLHLLEATNGKEALKVIANSTADLVLLDLHMPQMDGLVFLERFRRFHNNWITPVCVMANASEEGGRRRAADLGADDFIQKPIEGVELRTRIRSLLRIGHYQKELRTLNTELERHVQERTNALSANMNKLEAAHQEIDLAHRETVLRLTLAAEMQDECTSAHLERMSHYSALLAEKCGWSAENVALLTEAAKMHDIGKLGIPHQVLNKAGKLDKEEFAVMQQHPEIGARVLAGSKSKLLQMGATVALTHHERFDGTGYPQGLAAKSIPQVGRIVAIADVFDALMTRRSHKSAWSLKSTVAAMKREAGRHFDPDLLTLFLEDTRALVEIHTRFAEDSTWEHSTSIPMGKQIVPDTADVKGVVARFR